MTTVSKHTSEVKIQCFLISTKTDVIVNWERTEYTANEGAIIELCAIVQESTERPFTLDIVHPFAEG